MNKSPSKGRHLCTLSGTSLILGTVLFVTAFGNNGFWRVTSEVCPPDSFRNVLFLAALGFLSAVVTAIMLLPLTLFTPGRWVKPILFLFLLISAVCGYFMDSFGVVINRSMLQNAALTDRQEAWELITGQLFLYLALHALLPGVALFFVQVRVKSRRRELLSKTVCFLALLGLLLTGSVIWYKQLSLFSQQHRQIRLYMNPSYPLYSVYRFVEQRNKQNTKEPLAILAPDARRTALPEKTVMVLVIGETARASQFGLNGYERQTTPRLDELEILNFTDVHACETSTAEALPRIFSSMAPSDYKRSVALRIENLLDVLHRIGVGVLWRDNNSGSQGLASRVQFEDLSEAQNPRFCAAQGCFDEILLEGLEEQLAAFPGDSLVVLHQNGSHGPSYFRRTPEEFKKFLPECDSDSPQECEQNEIINAYDNTILYTDYVLAELIAMLERQPFPTLMLYISDHGESLGENNIYLHGLPLMISPIEQIHVPMVFWASEEFRASGAIDFDQLEAIGNSSVTHDHLFHSLFGLFGVKSEVYREDLDIFAPARHQR